MSMIQNNNLISEIFFTFTNVEEKFYISYYVAFLQSELFLSNA